MIDLVLLGGRIALIAFLYLFLMFAVKAGMGFVSGGKIKKGATFYITVTAGPAGLAGTSLPLTSSVLIGRSPDSDIAVADNLVSGTHARITPIADGAILEDLQSTNGTLLNGMSISTPQTLVPGDTITIGPLSIAVDVK